MQYNYYFCRHGGEFHENPQRKKSGGYRNRRKGLYTNGLNKGRKLTGFEYADEIEFEIPHRKLGQHCAEDIIDEKKDIQNWIVSTSNRERFGEWCGIFETLNPISGRISRTIVNVFLKKSGLNDSTFRDGILELADVDKDGMMDCNQFCLAMYLVELYFKQDIELPSELPRCMFPPLMVEKNTR